MKVIPHIFEECVTDEDACGLRFRQVGRSTSCGRHLPGVRFHPGRRARAAQLEMRANLDAAVGASARLQGGS